MTFLGLLVPLLSSGCGSAPDEPPVSVGVAPPEALEAPLEGVRERLRAVAEKGVAVSVALARSGEILWSETHGYAHAEERRPATPETRFRIYSVVKPMTAVAAARLMEAGRLDPNASVQRYVPDVAEHLGAVTAMQLATHTSGIRHYADEAEGRNRQHCESVEDAPALFSMDPLVHAPGERETSGLLTRKRKAAGDTSFPIRTAQSQFGFSAFSSRLLPPSPHVQLRLLLTSLSAFSPPPSRRSYPRPSAGGCMNGPSRRPWITPVLP
jgi:hypothetical protein